MRTIRPGMPGRPRMPVGQGIGKPAGMAPGMPSGPRMPVAQGVGKPTMGGLGGPLGPSPAINQNELQQAQMQATQTSGFSSTPAMGGVGKPLNPQVMPTAQPQSVPQSVRGAMMKKGGKVSSASKRADGIAQRGKTKGRFV